MKLKRINTIYFSPTGGTAEIVRFIARELAALLHLEEREIDLTRPENRKMQLQLGCDELLIMASPVYAGRLPNKLLPDYHALLKIADHMTSGVPCTACHYCTSHCPKGLDIPSLLKLYNEHTFTGGGFLAPMALQALPEDKRPSACIGCRSCEAVCPQQIKISEVMSDFSRKVKV